MARVTIEDCLEKLENRFALVLLVTKRAKQLLKGAKPVFNPEFDLSNKYVVLALRELAAGKVSYDLDISSSEAISHIEKNLQR